MPVFGKSLFETVLDGMEPEEPEDDEGLPVRRPRVVAHFLADTSYVERAEDRPLGELYEDFGEPLPIESEFPPSPGPPAWLDRLSEREIADDLGLTPAMSRAEIRQKRRSFATENHPDRVAEAFRASANVRMTVANRLVEAALHRAV